MSVNIRFERENKVKKKNKLLLLSIFTKTSMFRILNTVIKMLKCFMDLQNEQIQGYSPNQEAWRRFKKNKPAIFGMCVIQLATIMAILGYLISPDQTPNVNEQIPELALKNPGFQVTLLALRKNRTIAQRSLIGKMLYGQENAYKFIPVNHFEVKEDKLVYEQHEGTDLQTGLPIKGRQKEIRLADMVYALSFQEDTYSYDKPMVSFKNIDEQLISVNIDELTDQVLKENVLQKTFHMGTDKYGRSLLSRLILGVRVSLLVGLIAVIIALTIGIFLGALAAYYGGRIDEVILLLINTVWSIPTLLLVFAIVLALGRGIGIIFLAVGLTMWVDVARIVRGQVLALKEIQFVEAAKSMGFQSGRIIFRHILPNVLGPVMVIAASTFATAILIEAGLSYLGFGIQPPTPSWGTMLNENYGYAISGKPFLALIPALAIMLLVLAFNLVGNGLRDAMDVY
jgi:peptide/nickel transport system permease protein